MNNKFQRIFYYHYYRFCKAMIIMTPSMIAFHIGIFVPLLYFSIISCRNISYVFFIITLLFLYFGIKSKKETYIKFYFLFILATIISYFSPIDFCLRNNATNRIKFLPVILDNGTNSEKRNTFIINKLENEDYIIYKSPLSIDAPKYSLLLTY
jgi:hypothetical protein